MSSSQISSGLASAFAASALLGKAGAGALLIVLFMAVTSCASAELIAVSSVLTFDIFKTYIKPHATPSQLILTSHLMICVFGLTMALFACIWNLVGIDLGWLFLVMGLLIGGAVVRQLPCSLSQSTNVMLVPRCVCYNLAWANPSRSHLRSCCWSCCGSHCLARGSACLLRRVDHHDDRGMQ